MLLALCLAFSISTAAQNAPMVSPHTPAPFPCTRSHLTDPQMAPHVSGVPALAGHCQASFAGQTLLTPCCLHQLLAPIAHAANAVQQHSLVYICMMHNSASTSCISCAANSVQQRTLAEKLYPDMLLVKCQFPWCRLPFTC